MSRRTAVSRPWLSSWPVAAWKQLAGERGWEFIFSIYAFAQPAGRTVRHVYESLRDEMLSALEAALPVDIVLMPLHGAMVAEGYDDVTEETFLLVSVELQDADLGFSSCVLMRRGLQSSPDRNH